MKPLPKSLYDIYVYGNKKQLALEAWRVMKRYNEGVLIISPPHPEPSSLETPGTPITVIDMPERIQRRSLKFFIAEQDSTGEPAYYGYVGTDFNLVDAPWYIMKVTNSNSYRYHFGSWDFDKAWSIRASLSYDHAYKFKGFHDKYEIL